MGWFILWFLASIAVVLFFGAFIAVANEAEIDHQSDDSFEPESHRQTIVETSFE